MLCDPPCTSIHYSAEMIDNYEHTWTYMYVAIYLNPTNSQDFVCDMSIYVGIN